MGYSGLFLILFFSVFLINLVSAADPYFQFNCVNDGNFTANSTYGTNLNLLFSQLSTTADFNHGFYNLSVGWSLDQVNAIGLCRGDQKEVACRSCPIETISELKQRCPEYKEAIGWSEYYGDVFIWELSPFLRDLSRDAAAGGPLLKYAANYTAGIYALEQCTPDLSQKDCSQWRSQGVARGGACPPEI
ncbi:hypothetical protein SLEP1_g29535 [Rubroshorea leprosula]|uniref:Gnk2-homologous domain-containing protein n=1 Tax=Rubroshorea leprosula TaxID=152421 RepID=A0AAV5JX88_9ROSI|nr:hypothetical protein SLEP1_g29535 [Rubroshorea leprosula]